MTKSKDSSSSSRRWFRSRSEKARDRRPQPQADLADRSSKRRRMMMEGLEDRRMMAVLTEVPTQAIPASFPNFDAVRNVGTVPSFVYSEMESFENSTQNNTRTTAEFLPFGTGPGQEDTIDVSGTLPFRTTPANNVNLTDIDTYAFDLRAGDIIDIATSGSAGEFVVQGPFLVDANGNVTGSPPGNPSTAVSFASSVAVGGLSTPLQTQGNATGVIVAPDDGRYFLSVTTGGLLTTYGIGLRAYRPATESLVVGDAQILYLDFEGGLVENNLFLPPLDDGGINFGTTIVPSLAESLPLLGLEFGDFDTANEIAEGVYEEVIRIYEDIARTGTNGDFSQTGQAGDYAIRILSSNVPEHRFWFNSNENDPRLSRLLIGGAGTDIGIPGVFGIAENVDVGNFDLSQIGLFALDGFPGDQLGVQLAPTVSPLDATIRFLGSVAAHEAGHIFGMIHTVNNNTIPSLSDAGGDILSQLNGLGAGSDQIFGTLDDFDPIFRDDFYADPTVRRGFNRVTANFSHVLSSGTVGGVATTGFVFNDFNGDANPAGDPGLGGVTVFADLNGNGVLDASEPNAVTNSDGTFALTLPPGVSRISIQTPASFSATTALSLNSDGPLQFGLRRVNPNITGTTFVDTNGNGNREQGEGGLADVYVYIDLDEDNRPDLGEPATRSGSDGSYSLNFPGPGTYTVRQVLPPGFEQTSPTGGEHIVNFDGTTLNGNFDFGFLPSRDLGDAPDSYGTLDASNGASHAIVTGLALGTTVDRELDGVPSADATGDDSIGNPDDEDGVVLVSPLGRGVEAEFQVTTTNLTGSPAFLQAFFDFNGDGDFLDAGEQFRTDLPVADGTATQSLRVRVPDDAQIGDSFARFRISNQTGVGPLGFVSSGEVEDYSFSILQSGNVATDDSFTVARNSLANSFDVLDNDFSNGPISNLDLAGIRGNARIAPGGGSILYTPPVGGIGIDTFSYFVEDAFGTPVEAEVRVLISFLSNEPIAVDDSFEVPENSVNRPLNVLDNDVASVNGGLTIISTTAGDQGGAVSIIGGGQSIRYTPAPGFSGTEQFQYSVQDTAGLISTATVTINTLPRSQDDDEIGFSFRTFTSVGDRPNRLIGDDTIRVNDRFFLEVLVDDLDSQGVRGIGQEGVVSAFLDLLYTDALVTPVTVDGSDSNFPFNIEFGEFFSGSEGFLQRADGTTPGLLDEVGGIQPIGQAQQSFDGPVPLFRIQMQAISPGVAQFIADLPDNAVSENTILNQDTPVTRNQIRLGRTELVIVPDSDIFTAAVDDSFPDGIDSNNNAIVAGQQAILDVLANDNLGPTGTIRELVPAIDATLGQAVFDDNGTPGILNDDFIRYTPFAGVSGLESFTYTIVTEDNVRSSAEVTFPVGDVSDDQIVAIDLQFVDLVTGDPIDQISVGDEFGVQVIVDDLRTFNQTFVFAGFLDILYSSGLIQTVDTSSLDEFDFDVEFGPSFQGDAGVGTAATPGIIDEFGTVRDNTNTDNADPALLATITFEAIAPGTARVVGSPADAFPFQDTLLFNEDDPIPVSQITYGVDTLQVVTAEGESLQNTTMPQDVNDDGFVTAIDALLVINRLSRQGAEGEQAGSSSPLFYTDVNGDARTTALDALQIINYLSRNPDDATTANGELIAPTDTDNPSSIEVDPNDAVFADLTEAGSLFAQTDVAAASIQVDTTELPSPSQDDDDEVVDLLADDVLDLWS